VIRWLYPRHIFAEFAFGFAIGLMRQNHSDESIRVHFDTNMEAAKAVAGGN
jgi:hypothetical protein